MSPKTSILLPTYNGEKFLPEQLDSILAQSDADFELLAIDDGSSDGTVAVLEDYARRDSRMAIVPSQGNLGQNARIAELLGHVRGTYVAISDQDDRWASDRNAQLFDALGDRAMAFGRSELIDGAGAAIGKSLLELYYGRAFAEEDRLRALLQPMFSAHATIVRADAIGREALWHPLPFDWLMAVEALFADGLAYRDEAIVFHRIHGGNQMNNVRYGRGGARPASSDIRHMVMFQAPDRIRLWLMFDYLGRSLRIAPDLRRTFRTLGGACQTHWVSEQRALKSKDVGLRDRIIAALAPLAGSEADRAWFERQIGVLTQPLVSRAALGEMRRRFHLWRSR